METCTTCNGDGRCLSCGGPRPLGPREDENTVGASADGQAPDPQRVVADDDDAAESEVLVDLREVGKQQAGELLDPAADHPSHEHHGRTGFVGRGQQCSEVGVRADEYPAVVAGGLEDDSVLAARSPSEPTWTASQPSL